VARAAHFRACVKKQDGRQAEGLPSSQQATEPDACVTYPDAKLPKRPKNGEEITLGNSHSFLIRESLRSLQSF
jgi:hypothetical protein